MSCLAENDTRRECKCKLTPGLQLDGWPQEPGLCDLIDAPLFLVEKWEMHVTVAACAIDDRRLGSKARRSTYHAREPTKRCVLHRSIGIVLAL